jgi:hypothetical protein
MTKKRSFNVTDKYGEITPQELDVNSLPIGNPAGGVIIPDNQANVWEGGADAFIDQFKIRETETKLDRFLKGQAQPYESEEYMKGAVQSSFGKFANGLTSRALSVVPKALQTVGHVGAATAYGIQYLQDPDNADPNIIWDNAVVNLMEKVDREVLQEGIPVHTRKKYAEGNLIQQMGTAEFWARDFFDGVAFATQAYLPGAAVGAAGKALGMTKGLNALKIGSSTVINTVGESGYESKDLGDNMRYELAYKNYGADFDLLSPSQQQAVKNEVSPFQANTFKANMSVLGISNFVQSRFFFGPLTDNAQRIRRGVRAGTLSPDDVSTWKRAFNSFAKGAVTEGLWEEGIQAAVQDFEMRGARGVTDTDWLEGYAGAWVDNFTHTEGQKAMMLGALIGGPMGFVTSVQESLKEQEQVLREQELHEVLMGALRLVDGQYVENIKSIYKTFEKEIADTDEDGNPITKRIQSYFNEDGQTEIDLEKANKLFYQQVGDKQMWDEMMVAVLNNDEIHARVVKDNALARKLYRYISNPEFESTTEAAQAVKERFLESVPEEDRQITHGKNEAASKIDQFADMYQQIESQVADIEDFGKESEKIRFKEVLKKALFHEAIKRESLKEAKDLTENEKAQTEIDQLISDSENRSRQLRNKTTRNKLFKQYTREIKLQEDLNQQLEDEKAKDKPSQDKIRQLEYEMFEQEKIEGQPDPNSIFAVIEDETTRLGDFGLRNKFFFDTGMDTMVSGRVNNLIDDVVQRGTDPEEVINYIEANKNVITKEDVEKLDNLSRQLTENVDRLKEESKAANERIEEMMASEVGPQVEAILLGEQIPQGSEELAEEIRIEQQKIQDSLNATAELEDFITRLTEFKATAESRSKRQRFEDRGEEDRFFKRKVADMPVERAIAVDANYSINEDTYDKKEEVQNVIDDLNNQKEVYKDVERKKLLDTKEFSGYIKSLDDALKRMKEVLEKAINNFNNRAARDERHRVNANQAAFNALGLEVNQQDGTFEIINERIYNALRETIGHEIFDEIIEQAAKASYGDTSAKFHIIFAEKIFDKVKEAGRVKHVLGVIEEELGKSVAEFTKTYKNLGTFTELNKRFKTIDKQLGQYEQNPAKQFEVLIRNARGVKKTNRKTVLDRFFNDKDTLALREDLQQETNTGYSGITKDELLRILDIQIRIESLSRAVDTLESQFRIADQVAGEEIIAKSAEHAPSEQQSTAIRQAVKWFKKKLSKGQKRFQGWAYMKGIAGTGKTKLVMKWAKESLGLKAEEIMVVAHNKNALQTIYDSVRPKEEGVLVENFAADKVDKDIRLVIIDEVGALDTAQLKILGDEIVKANQGRAEPLHVFVLGDPTQINKSLTRDPDINDAERGQIYIHELQPLTVTFRSNVHSVLDVQDAFHDNFKQVTGLVARSNVPLGKQGIGAHVGNTSQALREQFNVHKDNGRSKVIIVFDEKGKQAYTDLQDNAEILTAIDVQGREFDEVYVDISPEQVEDIYLYNTVMYTATSRARQYIFINDHTNTFRNEESETVVLDEEEVNKRLEEAMDNYRSRLDFERSVLGDTMEKARPTVSESRPVESEEAIDYQETDTTDRTGVKEAHVQPGMGEVVEEGEVVIDIHDLEHPSYHTINYHKKSIEGPPVRIINGVHPRVKYIKTWNSNLKRPEIWVVAEELNNNGQPVKGETWHQIGVIGMKDLSKFPELNEAHIQMLDEVNDPKVAYNRLGAGQKKGKLLFTENHPSIIFEGTLKAFNPLTYRYHKTDSSDQGPGLIQRLLDKFNLGFFGRTQGSVRAYVKIFKKKDIFEGETIENTHFHAGMPYLIIEPVVTTGKGEEKETATQYIRLNPRRLRSTDRGIQDIQEFFDAILALEKIGVGTLGQREFNAFIKRFGNPEKGNFILDGKNVVPREEKLWTWETYQADPNNKFLPVLTQEQFEQFDSLIEPVIRLFYGYGQHRVPFSSEEEMRAYEEDGQKLYVDTSDDKYVFVKPSEGGSYGYVKRADPQDPQDPGEYVYVQGLTAGDGAAQNSLNILAKANSSVGGYKFRVQLPGRQTFAKSLLAEDDTYGEYYKHLISVFKQEIPEDKREGYTIVNANNFEKAENLLIDFGISTREKLDEAREKHRVETMTTKELKQILTFGAKGHKELWVPLDIDEINGLGANINMEGENEALEDYLSTSFLGVDRTRIQVQVTRPEEKRKPVEKIVKNVEDKAQQALNKLNKGIKRRTLRKGTHADLGEEISISTARKMIKQFVPDIADENIKFLTQMAMDQQAGEDLWGLFKNGTVYILKNENDRVYKNVVRHEIFHKIFNQYIREEERNRLINAFKKEFPDMKAIDDVEFEEKIAVRFQEWQKNKEYIKSGIIRSFFNKIARWLGLINKNTDNLDRFFRIIEDGYFRRARNDANGIERAMREIKKRFGGVDAYREIRAIVQEEFYLVARDGYDGLPVTRKEMYSTVLANLESDMHSMASHLRVKLKSIGEGDLKALEKLQGMKERVGLLNTILRKKISKEGSVKYVNYDHILKDIYPNQEFAAADIINPVVRLTDAEIFENWANMENGSIGKHTVQSDQVNYEGKLSESVKDFLSNIPFGETVLGWREAYVRGLQLMQGLQSWNKDFVKHINEAWKGVGSHKRSEVIKEFMVRLYLAAHESQITGEEGKGTLLTTTAKFLDEDTFIISDEPVTDIIGENDAQINGITPIRRNRRSTVDFVNKIVKDTGLPRNVVGELLIKEIAANTWRELTTNFLSQKEKRIRFGRKIESKKIRDRGLFSFSYRIGGNINPTSSLKSTIEDALRDKFDDPRRLKSYRNGSFPITKKRLTEDLNPNESFIKGFLIDLNLDYLAPYIPEDTSETVVNDILAFIDDHTIEVNKVGEFDEVLESEGGSMVLHLVDILNYNNEFVRATSVLDAERKKKYLWSPASHVNDILFNIINRKTSKDFRAKGKRTSFELPEYLKLPFFQKNIFANGQNFIYNVVDHDGFRAETFTGQEWPTSYRKEVRNEWLTRVFTFGFLSHLNGSRKGAEKYVQFFTTISDRPNIVGAEVGVLRPNALKDALRSNIEQISLRNADLEAGLENYSIDNLNNFEILKDILGRRDLRKKPIKASEINRLTEKAYAKLLEISREVTDTIIEEDLDLDRNMHKFQKMDKYIDKDLFPDYDRKKFITKRGETRVRQTYGEAKGGIREYNLTQEDLLPVVHTFVTNHYINSYNLNQLVTGDHAGFKSSGDMIKRMSLVFAPGQKGLVDPEIGMREKYKTMVIEDPLVYKEGGNDSLRSLLERMLPGKNIQPLLDKFGDDYMPGDGQGFVLPERADEIKRGFGNAYKVGRVMKPVHFEVDDSGIQRGIKYSVVELTDELVDQFSELGNLRDHMRRIGVQEAVFNSAVKVGNPIATSRVAWNDAISDREFEVAGAAVLTLNNNNYRMQLNPVADLDKGVSNPSQLNYFLNILEQNVSQAEMVYDAVSYLVDEGRMRYRESVSNSTSFREKLRKLFSGPGQERIYEMLADGLSINFPAIADKSVIQLASAVSREVLRIKFPGTGLVLQSQLGVVKYDGTPLEYGVNEEKRMYAEVFVPEGFLSSEDEDIIKAAIAKKEAPPDIYLYHDLLAFRIPSSELHSAVPLKVVGFYDSAGTNVIIAPRDLVPLHGSDFDVDELYVIKREVDKEDKPIGYSQKKGQWVLDETPTPGNEEAYYRNLITDTFLETITAERNRERMMSPISMKTLEDDIDRIESIRGEKITVDLDLSDPLGNMIAHEDVFSGAASVGIFANSIKTLAYSIRAGKRGSRPKLREFIDEQTDTDKTTRLIIDRKEYNELSDSPSLWEDLDSLLNAAIDNVKVRILPRLNLNTRTIPTYVAMRALGVSMETAHDIMMQPAIRNIGRDKRRRKWGMDRTRDLLIHTLKTDSNLDIPQYLESLDLPQVTQAMITRGMKHTEDIRSYYARKDSLSEEDREFLLEQLAILEKVYKNAFSIGEDITQLSFFTSIIRNMPIEKYRMDEVIASAKQMFGEIAEDGTISDKNWGKSKFSLDIQEFFKVNPHILSAYRSLMSLNALIENTFFKHSTQLYDFIKSVKKIVNPEMDRIAGKSDEMMRAEFLRYFMSGFKRFDDILPYKKIRGAETIELTGPKAFSQHMIDKVNQAKRIMPDNLFLSKLEEQYDPISKTKRLRFVGGSNLDALDMLDFQKAFEEMNVLEWTIEDGKYVMKAIEQPKHSEEYSNFQEDFVTYGILNFGLKFGVTNYSLIVPSKLYQEVDKQYTRELGKILSDKERMDRLVEHFAIELTMNHADLIPESDELVQYIQSVGKKEDGTNIRHGIEDGYVFDRKYANENGAKSFPLILRDSFDNRPEIYIRINDTNAETIYYQRIGGKNRVTVYNLNQDIIEEGYNRQAAFDPSIRNIPVANKKMNRVQYKGAKVSAGDMITLTDFHDVTRINKRTVVIKEIDGQWLAVKDGPTGLFSKLTAEKWSGILTDYLSKKDGPFRVVKGGRIVIKKDRFGEGRSLKNRINREEFKGTEVLKETGIKEGTRVYIDMEALEDYLYGRQGTLFSKSLEESLGTQEVANLKRIEENRIALLERYDVESEDVLTVLEKIHELTPSSYLKESIDAILPTIRKYNNKLNISYSWPFQEPHPGRYAWKSGTLYINIDGIADTSQDIAYSQLIADTTIVHEAVHAATATSYAIESDFRKQIDELYKIAKDKLPQGLYGMRSPHEFMAEFYSDRSFREELNNIKLPGQKKSLLQRIIDTILSWFRRSVPDVTVASKLNEVIRAYDSKVWTEKADLDELLAMVPNFEDLVEETLDAPVDVEVEVDDLEKIRRASNEIELPVDENGNEEDFYVRLGKKFRRITDTATGFVSHFVRRKEDSGRSYGEKKADMLWLNINHDTRLRNPETGELQTYDEYAKVMNQRLEEGKIKGKIVHKKIQRFLDDVTNGGRNREAYDIEIRDLASEVNVDANTYNWVEENIEQILHNAGINVLDTDVPADMQDKVLSEVRVASDLLGFAGAIDLLVQHHDGTFSITDWKTGRRFNDSLFVNILKFGNQEIEITDNPRERAKLQVMIYALMLKLENPDIQFRELSVTWIPSRYQSRRKDSFRTIEVNSYLPMLEAFLKDPISVKEAGLPSDIYIQMIKKSPKLFWASEYTSANKDSLTDEITNSAVPPEELLERKYADLRMIVSQEQDYQSLSTKDKAAARELLEDIQVMSRDPSMQLTPSRGYEIGKFVEWFGNYSDVPNPHLQIWKKYRDRQVNTFRFKARENLLGFQAILKPVKKNYMRGRFGVKAIGLEDINYPEMYGWAFKEDSHQGLIVERLLHRGDTEFDALDTSQKELLIYLNNYFKSWFVGPDAFMNQPGTYRQDQRTLEKRAFTNLEMINMDRDAAYGFEYYEGWFPKIPMTPEEIRYYAGKGSNIAGAFTKDFWNKSLRRRLTRFIENNYEGWPNSQSEVVEALPIKYLGSREIDTTRDYSKNLEFAFDHFNRSMNYKMHIDPVYTSGRALHNWLAMQKDGDGQPMYENTAGFLKKKLIGDILNRKMRIKYSRLPIRVLNEPIHVDNLIQLSLDWVSATIMWLRPMQGGGNGLHARMLTYRESLKGSIASSFLNIDGDAIDFKVKDNIFADKVYFTEFMPAAIQGKLRQNKMWLLAEKLEYLPDNFDYATNRRFLLSTRNKMIDKSSAYVFHSKPEEYVSLTTMVAQLHYLKHPKTGKSLWDHYKVVQDPKTGVWDVVWDGEARGKVKRGDNIYESITNLTGEEIAKLKKVHERMQGGYRKEEAGNLEIYVMGRAFIQLKKYLPRLLMNTYHSKRYEQDLGHWRETGERKDGESVYEWVARMNEGRWRTTINAMLTILTFNKMNRNYRWANLSSEQKQNVVDAMINLSMWFMSYSAYLQFFKDEDDDDTLKKWWKMYMVDNLTQQYNPMDLLRTLESATRPVALARTYKATSAFAQMTVALANAAIGDEEDAFTQQGDLRGWNEFKKAIPGAASYYDAVNKIRHSKSYTPEFLEEYQNKWR